MKDERRAAQRQARRWAPAVMASLVLLLGVAVLVGWLVESPALEQLHPSLPAMVPLTASLLILAAGALLGLQAGPPGRLPARLAATAVSVAGAAILARYVSNPSWTESGPRTFKTSPQSALTFLLLGLSLLCTGTKHRRVSALGPWLALLSLVTPAIALTGYALRESRLYGPGHGIGMALHTAVTLVMLAVGLLILDPERGPVGTLTSPAAGGMMARRMLPAALLPVAVGALLTELILGGLLEATLFASLFAVTMMVLLATLIWRNALHLNRLHAEQLKAEQQARAEAERQRALAADNARLYQSAHEAARQREEVLAIVSHDLKNPLSSIRLSTAVLSSRLSELPDAAGLSRQVGAINRAGAHMLTLIHELLDAARLDAGQALALEQRPEPVDTLVGEALSLIEPQASQKSLRLEQHLDTNLVVSCDRERILQVLSNLLGNAVKFTPEGGAIRVELRRCDGEVCVLVQDTGPGIPEPVRAHLFERHWQAERTARQGSGLGLYIARGIIDAHGGRIWVESTPGMGSTFTFTLPFQATKAPRGA